MSKDGKDSAKDAKEPEEKNTAETSSENEEKTDEAPESNDEDGDLETPTSEATDPNKPSQANIDTVNFIRLLANFAGAFLAMLSICMVLYVQTGETSATSRGLLYATFIGWAVVPPFWFLAEFRWIWPHLKNQGMTMVEFAHEQNLMRNLWFGIGAILAILLFLVK
ncbi:MAG: hypothetical protein P1V97_02410 [Planctomycetota bacterium]|nr:hypothetical protein [Planctomycetota bacterium]